MKPHSKLTYALEIIWLAIFIIVLGLGIHSTVTKGFNSSIVIYILTILSFIMYYFRRRHRIDER